MAEMLKRKLVYYVNKSGVHKREQEQSVTA